MPIRKVGHIPVPLAKKPGFDLQCPPARRDDAQPRSQTINGD